MTSLFIKACPHSFWGFSWLLEKTFVFFLIFIYLGTYPLIVIELSFISKEIKIFFELLRTTFSYKNKFKTDQYVILFSVEPNQAELSYIILGWKAVIVFHQICDIISD